MWRGFGPGPQSISSSLGGLADRRAARRADAPGETLSLRGGSLRAARLHGTLQRQHPQALGASHCSARSDCPLFQGAYPWRSAGGEFRTPLEHTGQQRHPVARNRWCVAPRAGRRASVPAVGTSKSGAEIDDVGNVFIGPSFAAVVRDVAVQPIKLAFGAGRENDLHSFPLLAALCAPTGLDPIQDHVARDCFARVGGIFVMTGNDFLAQPALDYRLALHERAHAIAHDLANRCIRAGFDFYFDDSRISCGSVM